jgi:hypothetical protein
MSSSITRWCSKHGHGYWEMDVKVLSSCPECEREGTTTEQLQAKLRERATLAGARAEAVEVSWENSRFLSYKSIQAALRAYREAE